MSKREEGLAFVLGKKVVGTIILVILIAGVILTSIVFVGVNEVAITYDPLSGANDRALSISAVGPGTVLKIPYWSAVHVDLSTQTEQMWTDYNDAGAVTAQGGDSNNAGQFPALDAPTQEGLFVYIDLTFRWHVNGQKLAELFKRFPSGTWRNDYVIPIIRQKIRDVAGQYSAIDIYGPKRQQIESEMLQTLTDSFNKDNFIMTDGFNMRKVDLPTDFAKSVEAKLIAQQDLEKASYQRQTVLIQANASASAMVIQAQGVAEAVNIISSQFKGLTHDELTAYISLKYIEALNAGLTQGNKVIILLPTTNGGNMILQLPNPNTTCQQGQTLNPTTGVCQ